MCGKWFGSDDDAAVAPGANVFVATREASGPRPPHVQPRRREATVDNASLAILALALLLIGCGISLEAPGLAILYTVIMLPALLAVYVKRQRRLASDRSVGWGDTIVDLFSGVALAIGILVALPIVSIIALMIYCAVIAAAHKSF
jgi:TRAP-type uncharacterized transport system fused permease subunit